jgi:FkbM family methyltransferase
MSKSWFKILTILKSSFLQIFNLLFFSRFFIDLLKFVSIHNADNSCKQSEYLQEIEWINFVIQQKHSSKSQLCQDLWVAHRTNEKTGGYFVELGACEPIRLSNSYLLETKYRWKGLLIEPNPAMANELRANRSASVSEIAVAKGESVTLIVTDSPEFAAISDARDRKRHPKAGSLNQEVIVMCKSLTEILDENNVPTNFDYLSIDIEGGELFALESLDFSRYSPRLITIEHNFQDYRKDLQDLLFSNGYKLDSLMSIYSWDDWYVKI